MNVLTLIQLALAGLAIAVVAWFLASLDNSAARGLAGRWRFLILSFGSELGRATLRERIDERAQVWEQMKTLMTESDGRSMTAEEVGKYDQLEARLDQLDADIDREEKFGKRSERYDKVETDPIVNPGSDPDDSERNAYLEAFKRWTQFGREELDPDQRKALRTGFVPAEKGEARAQSVGTTTAGGYLVPEGFRRQIIEKMKDYGAVQDVAQVITTETGATLPWPTNDDTSNVGALLAENTQVTEQDLTFGTADLGAYKYTSKLVRVSLEFLQDVDWIDAEDFLARKFAERLGRITNIHFTTGTGTAQPDGIVTSAVSGVTAAAVAAITADELIDLVHSVDPAYRRSNRARFMLSDTALKLVRKLKDSQNRYLWEPSVQAGVASSLFGYPYVINQDMAVPATGVKSVLFGDFFAGYVIRIVRGIQQLRLDERYADFLQVGFLAFERADGTAQDTAAYKALTQA